MQGFDCVSLCASVAKVVATPTGAAKAMVVPISQNITAVRRILAKGFRLENIGPPKSYLVMHH